jgi:hypothetical protein
MLGDDMKPSVQPNDRRLALLQRLDLYRQWTTVDDRRICFACDCEFSGREVRIRRATLSLQCPTRGCAGTPREWAYPGNPLTSETVYNDWWRALGGETEQSAATPAGTSLRHNHA